jgi:hypothetical protein
MNQVLGQESGLVMLAADAGRDESCETYPGLSLTLNLRAGEAQRDGRGNIPA